jgi:hypothetical protein
MITSTRALAEARAAGGHRVSDRTVARMLPGWDSAGKGDVHGGWNAPPASIPADTPTPT